MKNLILNLVVDGQLTSKGNIISPTGNFFENLLDWKFKVIEVVEAKSNIGNLKTGDIIELNKINIAFPNVSIEISS